MTFTSQLQAEIETDFQKVIPDSGSSQNMIEHYRYQDKSLSPAERARDLLSKMTLEEKVGQLNQRLYGFSIYDRSGSDFTLTEEFKAEVNKYGGLGVLYGLYRADPWSGKNYETGIEPNYAVSVYNQVQQYVMEASRFHIPMLMSSECPHGHQALDGYLLPVNLAMGATFSPALVQSAYEVCGRQLSYLGVDLALISVLDVLRDPRWGRSEECYSEDPYLCSRMAHAAVEGCQSQGVSVVAKHFCAQGEGTGGINASAARIGERELREIHLPAAYECCHAGVEGIMAAYNEIDGVYCHANKHLLNDLLRGEMGFQGVVMADGVAIDCLNEITGDSKRSGALALNSGVDISLWDQGFSLLDQAVREKLVAEEVLDQAVLRVLELKFKRGLFERPYLEASRELYKINYQHCTQSLELARQSIVLLENKENVLPLNRTKIKSIALLGPNADQLYHQLGDYSPYVRSEQGITLLQGMRSLAGDNIHIEYSMGCGIVTGDEATIPQAVETAKACDIIVLALGGSSSRFLRASFDSNGAALTNGALSMDCGEGVDCSNLELPGYQKKLAEAIFALGKPVITILIQGRPYAVPDIAEKSAGLLCCFYPGMQGGQAIAEILFGLRAPNGRLPVSIARHVGQLPVYYNYKASYHSMNYYDAEKSPLYPFGYGMTYTSFTYSAFQLSHTSLTLDELYQTELTLRFCIKNEGAFDSYAVPQLYIRDLQSSTVTRIRELKGFTKVFLASGETKEASIALSRRELSIWNSEMKHVVEAGDFIFYLCDMGHELWSGTFTAV